MVKISLVRVESSVVVVKGAELSLEMVESSVVEIG